jgi:hypothetical protein
MGEAKRRKLLGITDKTINRRNRFVLLCKKITRYTDKEIERFMRIRIEERRL